MNRELFRSMQDQLRPDPAALDALKEKMETAPVRKRPRYGRYAAIAACAALAIAAVPVYKALNRPPLHAYTVSQQTGTVFTETAGTADMGGGITDLLAPLEDAGPDEDHRPGPVEDAQDVAVPGVDAPNTGDLPGGAYLGEADVAAQGEAVAAYERLMARFRSQYGADAYPEWYGGAYIDEYDRLIVAVVENGEDQKPLYREIEGLCGSSQVGFTDAKYAYAHLRRLQEQVVELTVREKLPFMTCGVDEEENKLHLQVNEASDALLAALYKLDPEGDAIAVTVCPDTAMVVTDLAVAE